MAVEKNPSPVPAPAPVRIAGLLVGLQGLAGLAFAVLLLLEGADRPGMSVVGEAGYFVVIFGGVLACGIGLLLGKRWARGPVTAMQILFLGVSWYAIGPSGRPELGLPLAAVCIAALVLLFQLSSRVWADGQTD